MMKHKKIQGRISDILDIAPELKRVIETSDSLDEKRTQIRRILSLLLADTFDDNPPIHSLEWVMKRDAIRVFRTILSKRSEQLSEFNMLDYVDRWFHLRDVGGLTPPSPGFLTEFENLLKGIMDRTGIYNEEIPAFLKHEGARAARLRSRYLSQMGAATRKHMTRYVDGLEDEVIRRRSRNKQRILKHFKATELEWEDWRWHTRHIIKDADTLSRLVELNEEEYEAVRQARANKIPFGITPYYLTLLDDDADSPLDRAVRAQVIPTMHYVETIRKSLDQAETSMDFMLERDTSPIDGITRRYPMIVILKPILTCPQICVYCQRNWEIEDVHSTDAVLLKSKLSESIQWIADRPEIMEVLITGGDPLLLSDARIDAIVTELSKISHVQRIRIGTRTPVTLPQRITDKLARSISRFHQPGRREIIIVTHFEHQYEITPQSMEAVQKFRRNGIEVYNQLVYTFYNSRRFEAADLRHKLRLIGVTPYYTFNTKGKDETDDFRVPVARLLQEQKEEARILPGTARTDEIVFNVPKLGKNYLRAEQHHDVISILPDGRRVYEFHPWEKNLALIDTYIYTDVSIYEYLNRLRTRGESLADYKTIWCYY